MNDSADQFLTSDERATLAAMIARQTLAQVAVEMHVSPHTLRSIVGGLRGQRGTIALVRQTLAQVAKADR